MYFLFRSQLGFRLVESPPCCSEWCFSSSTCSWLKGQAMGESSSFVLFSKMQGTSLCALRFCLRSWDGGRCTFSGWIPGSAHQLGMLRDRVLALCPTSPLHASGLGPSADTEVIQYLIYTQRFTLAGRDSAETVPSFTGSYHQMQKAWARNVHGEHGPCTQDVAVWPSNMLSSSFSCSSRMGRVPRKYHLVTLQSACAAHRSGNLRDFFFKGKC